MQVTRFHIEGPVLLEPQVFHDSRGYFFESYSKERFESIGIHDDFVQSNQSLSQKDVLRGLHFQAAPFAQSKLVRVIKGAVLDVIVDIRTGSPTYGQYLSAVLSEENKQMFYIPVGFAHGFLTLENQTIFTYKCGNYYNKASEAGIMWNDPEIGIDWGIKKPLVSEKDQVNEHFLNFKSPFHF